VPNSPDNPDCHILEALIGPLRPRKETTRTSHPTRTDPARRFQPVNPAQFSTGVDIRAGKSTRCQVVNQHLTWRPSS
jgi:hypothetical protein